MKNLISGLILTVVLCLYSSTSLKAQVIYNDMQAAKTAAISQNKLIVINFGAQWSDPSKAMDLDLWNNPKYQDLLSNYVVLKYDIDHDRILPKRFGVSKLPHVSIITANEDLIYEPRNAEDTNKLIDLLKEGPSDLKNIGRAIANIKDKKNITASEYLTLGTEYGDVGRNTSSKIMRNAFLNRSNHYLKKCVKQKEGEKFAKLCKQYTLLNKAYKGQYKKVIKKAEKSPKLKGDILNYTLAYCYFNTQQEKAFKKYKGKVKNPKLQKQLEDLSQKRM